MKLIYDDISHSTTHLKKNIKNPNHYLTGVFYVLLKFGGDGEIRNLYKQ